MKTLKLLLSAISILAFAFILKSCKKTEDPGVQENLEKGTPGAERTIQSLSQQLSENPQMAAILFPVNARVPIHYEDRDGNIITASGGNNFTYQCLPADEMDYPPYAGISSISRFYDCNQGYKFTITWYVTTSVNLVASSGSSLTRGRLRIKDIFGATVYSTTSVTPVTITLTGDDPSTGNNNHIYSVSYTTAWLPFSYFTPNTVSFEHSLVAYTDCPDAISIVSAYFPTSYGLDASTPCNRVDPVAVNSAYVSGGTYVDNGVATGFRGMINPPCPSPAVYPDRQQIQIKYVGSGSTDNWRDIVPTSSVSAPPGTVGNLYPYNPATQAGTIGLFDFYYFSNTDIKPSIGGVISTTPVHGSYKIRYRNRMMPLSSGCAGDWSPELTRSL